MSAQVTIERLGHLGDGIAAGPVYVPGALPGEVVEGEVTDGVMAAPRIVTPAPERVRPPCPHAKTCGGCQLQHADPGFTASWKEEVVRAALAAHGLEAEILPILTSPPGSRRRAGLSARRTKSGALAGFHRKRSDVIVPVPDCQVLRPSLVAALPMVEALARAGASRKAELTALVTETRTGLDVAVTGGKPLDPALRSELAEIARRFDLARIDWQGEEALTRRAPVVSFGGVELVPPPGAFLQATEEGEAALVHAVAGIVGDASRVADLFAGLGTFTLLLARRAAVEAYEGARTMVAALDQAVRHAQGLKPVSARARDLFRDPLRAEELAKLDAVVIDPPRAGAEAQVAEIARAGVPTVAHVSCNPVTFARDCATLVAAGYRLGPVQPVDQFRWSTHVELVAGLTRAG
ncbi:class I SAM-dependent RNA methyltransferase [Litorisediminicola beolgyonensis]|uniref:Class I SAM-dependent RNA methyltransferase n=1 Tax=Litorisediminicola beolgyonensis TaxID=1173614 RepID=A0ABW3ZLI3_9RHOB